jgi:nucleotide-binding universal stress UspA family protein
LNDLPESQRAWRTAIHLARLYNIELATVSILRGIPDYAPFSIVVDSEAPVAMMEDRRNRHKEMHQKAANLARNLSVLVQGSIVLGNEMPAILHFAKEQNVELLVVGLHQHDFYLSRLWNFVYYLAQDDTCSVVGVY